jgi:hypothetical protein
MGYAHSCLTKIRNLTEKKKKYCTHLYFLKSDPCPSKTHTHCNFGFSTTARVQQRLVGFMRPENGNTQQMQQELQRKFQGN